MKYIFGKELTFKQWEKNNRQNEYGQAIFEFTKKYVELMEKKLNEDSSLKLKDIAEELSYSVGDEQNISAFMFCASVKILSLTWYKGEELRQWFNGMYDYTGKGLVHNCLLQVDEVTGKTSGYETELLLEEGEVITPFMQEKYED